MTADTRRYLFDEPGSYRIRVQGRLETGGSEGFACLADCTSRVRGKSPVTTLTGSVIDQAGLISVLTLLYDMGYPLLDVQRLPDKAAGSPLL